MVNRVTSFRLDWFDCGLCCAADVVNERITISRNKKQMVFQKLNGYGDILSTEEIQIPMVEDFFTFIEENENDWKTDYSVEVCDGSMWEVLVRYSNHKIKKIYGTVAYPPFGIEIENYIKGFVEHSEIISEPIMFGCGELE